MPCCGHRVSSTLDKTVGKKCLTDGSVETCWTSQQVRIFRRHSSTSSHPVDLPQGTPQYIQISFDTAVIPRRVELTFQGGFVGRRCSVDVVLPGEKEWKTLTRIYPEDVNRKQTFDLTSQDPDLGQTAVQGLKLVFEESSDFFGRITVYDLQIFGTKA